MFDRLFCAFLTAAASLQAAPAPEVSLTPNEAREVANRIRRFADPADTAIMSDALPRHSADGTSLPIAGNTRVIRQSLCRGVAKHYFPSLFQQTWESIATYDRVDRLTQTWIPANKLSWDPAQMPIEGKTKLPLWSGDYWSLRNGATSYRYATGQWFPSYDAAVASYRQPADWKSALNLPLADLTQLVHQWSPAEKWDLTVGDTDFTLTQQQKAAGARYRDETGDVAGWMGLCHGWAAASIAVPRPERPVDFVGASGVKISWLPDEVRSMVTLAWANAEIPTNYVGGRCDEKNAATYPNGRLRQPECFDTNPSTFYLALGNLLGRQGSSFIMDISFDYQVWNQPVVAYRFQYFDPTEPNRTSDDWRKVAVDYDSRFKARDRFQHPLTRGQRDAAGRYDDRGIDKVVGVAATVAYLAETRPSGSAQPTPDDLRRLTFTFDLELSRRGSGYAATGGEWHENAHPDFLWVPRAGITALTAFDRPDVKFTGREIPSPDVTQIASRGSQRGYPICRVLKPLIDSSSGTRTYHCSVR